MSGGGNVGPVATASCGLTFPCPDDLESKLEVVTSSGYDFMAVPIVHPRYRHFYTFSRVCIYAMIVNLNFTTSSGSGGLREDFYGCF